MNTRKTLLIIGTIALAALATLLGFALYSNYSLERDKNRDKTLSARLTKLRKRAQQQEHETEEPEEPELTPDTVSEKEESDDTFGLAEEEMKKEIEELTNNA